jgi:hypothetical protein
MAVDHIISYRDVVTAESGLHRPLACWFSAASRNELNRPYRKPLMTGE